MFFVYILKSLKDNKRYIGITSDLDRRISEHTQGLVKSTRNRRPLILIHTEFFQTKTEAEQQEKFYKSGLGRQVLKKLNL